MKIGMIGIGDIAKKAYLPVLTQMEGIELYICTRNEKVLRETAAKCKINYTYTDMNELLKSGIKAAFVHSATASHEEIINKLLDNDVHVYVDKPITSDGESSKRLVEKAKSKGLVLMAGFNRRYAPPYQKLKEIENPNLIIMQKNRGHQASDLRTFVFDDFIHVIDTLLYLFPYKIDNIRISGKQVDGLLHHVILQLESEQGTAIGIMNREAGTSEEKVEVMSSNETRVVKNVNEIFTHKDRQILNYGSNDWEPTLYKRGFHGVVSAFIEAVNNGSKSYDGYDRDLQGHQIAEKVVQTLK
ncbi:Gfo/Idh/MocA family protein [Paenibacillus montanisoli]|uniref:Gfo/Idh/MocA family oxidoreductase n=1 Tax=Paenibacillus montanisoli TaxID=2081970 RepID=A0A328TX21_9BACL|nr:Gfo/Idh/MocA family oxidoreductase [Paenibacillus montanisoli]RAP74232.1 gfo/Idh/MocA family oxidoreductase [Paenibacillus montanisoli]